MEHNNHTFVDTWRLNLAHFALVEHDHIIRNTKVLLTLIFNYITTGFLVWKISESILNNINCAKIMKVAFIV